MLRPINCALTLAIALVAAPLTGCDPEEITPPDAGDRIDAGDAGDRVDAAPLDATAPDDSALPLDATPAEDGGPDAGPCGMDCSAIEAPPCMMSVCGAAGECVMMPLPDDTACDDGDFCTVGETCAAGVCTGAPNDCGLVPGPCLEVACNSATEMCSFRAATAMEGMACAHPDLCVTGTTCSSGLCTGGTRRDCAAGSGGCQAGSCNPATGACEVTNINEGNVCADPLNPCIVDSTCTAGACGGGSTVRDCSGMDGTCVVGVCNPTDGSCTTAPAAEGVACDDGMSCTSATVCTSGVCAGGTSPACSMTQDACCPGSCNELNDADCACPGELVGSTCVYLPTTATVVGQATARAACNALGTGWDLCGPTVLCTPQIETYLADTGMSCTGGAATGACSGSVNVYVHVDGPDSPYYVRGPGLPGCSTSASCTRSVTATCGAPLCCR